MSTQPNLVIDVHVRTEVSGNSLILSKGDTNPNWRIEDDGEQNLLLDRKKLTWPVKLEFDIKTASFGFVGIGFQPVIENLMPYPEIYSSVGSCGPGFEIVSVGGELEAGESIAYSQLVVEDEGTDLKLGYAFRMEVANVHGSSFSFDPRIYNRGNIGDGGWFGALIRWLRRLFGIGN